MSRVSQTTQVVGPFASGLLATLTAPTASAGNGDIVDCGNHVFVLVVNAGAAVIATIKTNVSQDGVALPDRTVSCATGTTLIGPLPARTYGQTAVPADAGRCYIEWSATTVTRAVVQVTHP